MARAKTNRYHLANVIKSMLKSSKVEEEKARRAHSSGSYHRRWRGSIMNRLHTTNCGLSLTCQLANALQRGATSTKPKKKCQIQRLETPLWSCMQSTRRTTLGRQNFLPVYSPSPGLAMPWLIPTRHQSSLSWGMRERSNCEIGVAGDV